MSVDYMEMINSISPDKIGEESNYYIQKYILKSNKLITAKFKSSLLGNKIMTIALNKMDSEGKAELQPSDITYLLGNDKNLYRKLKSIAQTLPGQIITIENTNGKKGFHTFAVITDAIYKDNVLTIIFNKHLQFLVNDLKSGYTQLELATLMSIQRAPTYRLYELLKKEMFRLQWTDRNYIPIQYDLNDLRGKIGLINLDATYIRQALEKGASWDEIMPTIKSDDILYSKASEFKRNILIPAQKEMQELTDIRFDYDFIKGTHGKITHIIFYVSMNESSQQAKKIIKEKSKRLQKVLPDYSLLAPGIPQNSERPSSDFVEKYNVVKQALRQRNNRSAFIQPFTLEYFDQLLDLADGDIDRILQQIEYSKKVEHIHSYFAWLRKAVAENYAEASVSSDEEETAESVKILNESLQNDTSLHDRIWQRYVEKGEYNELLEYLGVDDDIFKMLYPTSKEKIEIMIEYRKYKQH